MPVFTNKLKPFIVQPYSFKAKDGLIKQRQKKNFDSKLSQSLDTARKLLKHYKITMTRLPEVVD